MSAPEIKLVPGADVNPAEVACRPSKRRRQGLARVEGSAVMSAVKLTQPQRRLLIAAAAHKIGRVIGGDPRTIDALIAKGFIAGDGHHYGPLFKITDAGRAAIQVTR